MTLKDLKSVIDGPVMIRAGKIHDTLDSLRCREARKYWDCEVLTIGTANFKLCITVEP